MSDNILVPVDFSTQTVTSCRYALLLAKLMNKNIILFHSFFDQLYFSDGGFATGFESGIMLTDEIILDFYRQKEARLNEIAGELSDILLKEGHKGITITSRMESGDPEIQILNVIQKTDPFLIVMGSSGMGKKGLFSGSVARRIIDNTKTPVIAVPELDNLPEITSVAYMTNFDPADAEVIEQIYRMLSPADIQFHCLHLADSMEESEAREQMDKLAKQDQPRITGSKLTRHVIPCTDPRSALQEFVDEHHINLIAFIPHKRNIFKNLVRQSLTKEDLFMTRIPILAFPSNS